MDKILQETMGKQVAEWAEQSARLQASRRNRGIYEVLTDDKDHFKVIADARLKLEKETGPAVPCIEKEDSRGKPQAVATSIDASEEQSDSENTGACGKVKGQHTGPHRRKRICGKLSLWLGTQASFYSRSNEDARSQSRSGQRMEQTKDDSSVGCQERKTKV